MRMHKIGAGLAALFLLAGCADAIRDEGLQTVGDLTRERIGKTAVFFREDGEIAAAGDRTRDLLSRPLDPDAAVEVALLNNKGIQATLAGIGVAAADLAEARLPPAPGFSFARTDKGGIREIERSVGGSVLGLLALPVAASIESRHFEGSQWRTAMEVAGFAADTRRAWYRAVAARAIAR